MADEPVFFSGAAEALFQGLSPLTDAEALRARLQSEGLDFDRLPPAIPRATFLGHIRTAATFVWPQLPLDEALRLAGFSQIRGWQNTALGRASSALLRIIGIERTLKRLDRAFHTTDNFTRTQVTIVRPGEALVIFENELPYPTYLVGILQAGIEMLGRKGQVELEEVTPVRAQMRVTWE